MEPWCGRGAEEMEEGGRMGVHVAQKTSPAGMAAAFDAVTVNAAKVLGLSGYGLDVGCNADFVVLQASDPAEAIRLRANRLAVVRRGQVIARSAPRLSGLSPPGPPRTVDGATPRGCGAA